MPKMDFPQCPDGKVVKLPVAAHPSLYVLHFISLSHSVFHSVLNMPREELQSFLSFHRLRHDYSNYLKLN